MSEYQYYESQAVDRPLNEKQMQELRSYSTRARITRTSFVNDYSWGNFKGNPDGRMEKYFDAFLYLANWGTHILKLRLPSRLLDLRTARQYCVGDSAVARESRGNVILSFGSDEEGDWARIEGLIATKQPKRYDEAVKLLLDLRDLAARKGADDKFRMRMESIRAAHARKPSFLDRLRKAGL